MMNENTLKNMYLMLMLSPVIFITLGQCERTSHMIYETLQLKTFGVCYRRLNATHQIGCSSSRGGNVGTLHYVQNDSDLDWLIQNGTHTPYVALLSSANFNRPIMSKLKESGKITGVLVINSNSTEAPEMFSPDNSCPNAQFELYKDDPEYAHCQNTTWNEAGNGLMFDDFDFPIIALANGSEVDFLIECFRKHNSPKVDKPISYPLCSAHLKDAMDAAKDSETCMRRSRLTTNIFSPQKYCDPIGDYNVFSFVHETNNSVKLEEKSIIIASARIDAFSFFDKFYPGANSPVTGLVSLLAAAEAIGKVKEQMKDNGKHIMFTFFNGEAFDYIGSERMIFEMEERNFPYAVWNKDAESELPKHGPQRVRLENIKSFIEVSQVGLRQDKQLWLHTDPTIMRSENNKIEEMIKERAEDVGLAVNDSPAVQPLPPASLQSFLKNTNISGVVLADHKTVYTNKYYNSRFDLASHLDLDYPDSENTTEEEKYNHVGGLAVELQKVATVLAQSLYSMSDDTSSDVSHIQADNVTVANLLYCFLVSASCDLFNSTLDEKNSEKLPNQPYPLYVGVNSDHNTNKHQVTIQLRNLLAYFLGDIIHAKQDECSMDKQDDPAVRFDNLFIAKPSSDEYHNYVWVQGPANTTSENKYRSGMCLRHLANYSEARSPAFDIDDYQYSSNKYSTWTESMWGRDAMLVKVFLVPSKEKEIIMLCVGLTLFAVFMVFGYFLSKKGSLLFPPRSRNYT